MASLRVPAVVGATATLVLLGALVPAYAGGSFHHCVNQAANHGGEPPTCTKVNGTWVASWPDSTQMTLLSDDGGPGTGRVGMGGAEARRSCADRARWRADE